LQVIARWAKVELFDDASHLFWWEDPERAAALLAALGRGG
jgi:pimeloyl-ACP methyl ester carboxylesterase